jgi:hypothetical protein
MISDLLLNLNNNYLSKIDNIKYCDYLIEYPVSNIIKFDWKKILENPPTNNSPKTHKELLQISKLSNNRTQKEIDLIHSIDDNANFLIDQTVKKYGLQFSKELFDDFYSVIKPLIWNTKFYYNRARPYQLASFYNIDINVIETLTHHTPSYPSGHTVYTCLAVLILSKTYPKLANELEQILNVTTECRMRQGVHFKSDCEASIELTKFVYEKLHKLIESKYHG